jgi:predicted AAA+ superfamily ATPase
MVDLRGVLADFNPWWASSWSVDYKDRIIFSEIKRFLKERQIIALTGLRRVGKTTLMEKIVFDALNDGFDSKRILYFSFDHFKSIELKELVDVFLDLTKNSIRDGKFIFLFDEIQKVVDWENQLKMIYDLYKNIKIIVSGSESFFIKSRSKESLAGRIFVFTIGQLSFKEFLTFKGVKFDNIDLHAKELLVLFDEFVLTQGFPELVGKNDRIVIGKYLREGVVDKVLYQDMVKVIPLMDVSLAEPLLESITDDPGRIIELQDFSKDFGFTRQKVSEHLKYLEEAFLIKKLYNYSRNKRKSERKLKKYYPSIIFPELLFKEDSDSKSKVFEQAVVRELNATFFWRDSSKNEVDIIKTDKGVLPIEVKFGRVEVEGLLAFMEKFGLREGVVLTRNSDQVLIFGNKKIKVFPAWKWFLIK